MLEPLLRDRRGLSPVLSVLLIFASVAILIAGMRAAAPLLTPFLLAIFIAVLTAPPLFFLRRRGFPTWAALSVVVAALLAAGGVLTVIIGGSLNDFSANLPEYEARLRQQVGELLAWLRGFGIDVPREAFTSLLDPAEAMHLAGQMLSGLGGLLANAFLILLTVVFLLFEASQMPDKLRAALKRPEKPLQRLEAIASNINRYMAIKTLTSLLTGAGVALWLGFLGVDFPLLWGLVAFLLNFVPNIGSIIAAIPAVLLALVQLGLGSALWSALGYLLINGLVGNVLEPRVMGRGLGLSTLVVFVSLVFWGWVLGPVGMFLSVPLTMSLKIALDSSPETRPVAVLLGSDVVPRPPAQSPVDAPATPDKNA